MKNKLYLLVLSLIISISAFGQIILPDSTLASGTYPMPSGLTYRGLNVNGQQTFYAYNSVTGKYSLMYTGQQINQRFLTINGASGQYVSLNGSYSNPTWITSLAWSKISGTPTTLAGYGISDAYTQTQINNLLAGYVPVGRTLTINGTTYDLSLNRSWSVGTVTSISSPNSDIGITSPTTTPVISLNNINGFTKTYYDPTSSIQTQLNGKQATIGYTPENQANKTAIPSSSTTTYPNWLGVQNYVSSYTGNLPTQTSFKTSAYTASVNEIVRVDNSAQSVPVTLPNSPADKSFIEVKIVLAASPYVTTITASGTDRFNSSSGPTTITLSSPNNLGESRSFIYDAANKWWTITGSDQTSKTAALINSVALKADRAMTNLPTPTNVPITSADSLLGAQAKLQGQLNNKDLAKSIYGSTVSVVGDSFTFLDVWPTAIAAKYNLTYLYKTGVSGGALTGGSATWVGDGTNRPSGISRVPAALASGAKNLILAMGSNDFILAAPIGVFGNSDTTTFMGAAGKACVLAAAAGARVTFVLPIFRNDSQYGPSANRPNATYYNGSISSGATNATTMQPYINALKEIAYAYGADVIDMSQCGINLSNYSTYLNSDQVHPNAAGTILYVNFFADNIVSQSSYVSPFSTREITNYSDFNAVTNDNTQAEGLKVSNSNSGALALAGLKMRNYLDRGADFYTTNANNANGEGNFWTSHNSLPLTINYNDATTIKYTQDGTGHTFIGNVKADNLFKADGTTPYITVAGARAGLSATNPITYNSTTGLIAFNPVLTTTLTATGFIAGTKSTAASSQLSAISNLNGSVSAGIAYPQTLGNTAGSGFQVGQAAYQNFALGAAVGPTAQAGAIVTATDGSTLYKIGTYKVASGTIVDAITVDALQNTLFGGNATAPKFITSGGTSSQVVLGDGTLGTYSGGTNYWSRSGTTLSPTTAGDGISVNSIQTNANTGFFIHNANSGAELKLAYPGASTTSFLQNFQSASGTIALLENLTQIVEISSGTVTQTGAANTIYIPHATSQTTISLPPETSPVGTLLQVVGEGSGGWKISQATGQFITGVGGFVSTTGTAGYVNSTDAACTISLRKTASNKWTITSSQGTINKN